MFPPPAGGGNTENHKKDIKSPLRAEAPAGSGYGASATEADASVWAGLETGRPSVFEKGRFDPNMGGVSVFN